MRWWRFVGVVLAVLAGCGSEDAAPSPDDARACLKRDGFKVLGGPRAAGDRNAPDTEVIVGGKEASAFLAYYEDEARAERYQPEIEKNAIRFDGAVERHGALTILWVRGKHTEEADRIQPCVR